MLCRLTDLPLLPLVLLTVAFLFPSAPLPAQPPPPPQPKLWLYPGGAIGETAVLRIDDTLNPGVNYVLGMSFSMTANHYSLRLLPPVTLLTAGKFGSQAKVQFLMPVPNTSALIGTVIHLQAATGGGTAWNYSFALTWALATQNAPGFTRAVPSSQSVSRSTVEALRDGTFLFTGGVTGQYPNLPTMTDAIRVYDPKVNQFRAAGKLTTARISHTAQELRDGTVLIAGGNESSSQTAEVYDPNTAVSRKLGPLPYQLSEYGTVTHFIDPMMNREYVLFAGGGSWLAPSAAAMLYDVQTCGFVRLPDMGTGRVDASAVVLPGTGAVLITGGTNGKTTLASAEVFLISTRRFHPFGNMTRPRLGHAMMALDSRYVIISGGMDSGLRHFDDIEIFDTVTGAATRLPQRLRVGRSDHLMVPRPSGEILVCGGFSFHADASRVAERLTVAGSIPVRPVPNEEPAVSFKAGKTGSVLGWGGTAMHYLK